MDGWWGLGDAAWAPPPWLGQETPMKGLADTKPPPRNGLPKYLLEYFVTSEGGKLSPA